MKDTLWDIRFGIPCLCASLGLQVWRLSLNNHVGTPAFVFSFNLIQITPLLRGGSRNSSRGGGAWGGGFWAGILQMGGGGLGSRSAGMFIY